MAKNKAVKPPRSRPVSTSELNQPLLPSAGSVTASTASCSFSPAPDHTLFAHISNQVHQQRLRIYSASASAASSSQLVTDFLLASLGGAECLASHWVRLSTSSSKSAKRRKHGAENGSDASSASSSQLLLALGLSSGQVHLLSPALAQSVAILDASSASGSSTSSAANTGVVSMAFSDDKATLFACSKNGWVSAFALADVKLGDQQAPLRPFASFRPDTKTAVQLLASRRDLVLSAHHAISLTDASHSDTTVRASFTGHASPVTHLEWLSDNSFVSAAEGDRIVSAWTFDDAKTGKAVTGRAFATAALDGPVRALSVCPASTQHPRTLITVVTQTGNVRIYGLPAESKSDASPSKKKSAALPSLELLAQSSTQSSASAAEWIDARLVSDKLRLARLIRGAKVSIDETTVLSGKDAQLQKTIQLPVSGSKNASSSGLLAAESEEAQLTGGASATQRYADAPMRPQGMDEEGLAANLEDAGVVGAAPSARGAELEPTLAQRLKELGFSDPAHAGMEADEDDAQLPSKKQQALTNEASLASSLSQALHSSDTSLLTSCLNHNDPILIRNTVRKISGPLSVKLLEECVNRLNGVGGHHVSKGSMGSQKARGLMEWVRATLLNHMGYLMSLPNLVGRLSGLHATLTTRLATHERLLALNGRLELVLSQIEARAAYMSQASNNQVRIQGAKFGKKMQGDANAQHASVDKQRRKGKKWVEETDDSDSDADGMELDDENGVLVRGENDEDGDVQDIALGAESEEDDEDDSDDEDAGPLRRRRRAKNGRPSDGNTSAESDSEADEDEDIEDIGDVDEDEDDVDDEDEDEDDEDEEDEDEEELPDESDLEEEGASDMEDDDEEEEYDEEDGGRGPNGMFDLEAEEGTDEDDEE